MVQTKANKKVFINCFFRSVYVDYELQHAYQCCVTKNLRLGITELLLFKVKVHVMCSNKHVLIVNSYVCERCMLVGVWVIE